MAGDRTRASGALEAEIMRILRASSEPVSAAEVRDACVGRKPAYTTVLTILDRLGAKGMVERRALSPRKVRFAPTQDDAQHATESIRSTLDASTDRRAALLHFAGSLDDADAALLREALRRHR